MEKLGNIITTNNITEPPEIAQIKAFVQKKYSSAVQVAIQPKQIIIITASAALAGSLRLDLGELGKQLQTDKKLLIRIGMTA